MSVGFYGSSEGGAKPSLTVSPSTPLHPTGLLASSTTSNYFHREPLNQVAWIVAGARVGGGGGGGGGGALFSGDGTRADQLAGGYSIATVTSEGKVGLRGMRACCHCRAFDRARLSRAEPRLSTNLNQPAPAAPTRQVLMWTLANSLQHPTRGYLLMARPPPTTSSGAVAAGFDRDRDRDLDFRSKRGKDNSRVVAGACALDFQASRSRGHRGRFSSGSRTSSFVVGTEAGSLYRCHQPSSATSVPSGINVRDWSPSALELLQSIENRTDRRDVVQHVLAHIGRGGSKVGTLFVRAGSGGGVVYSALLGL